VRGENKRRCGQSPCKGGGDQQIQPRYESQGMGPMEKKHFIHQGTGIKNTGRDQSVRRGEKREKGLVLHLRA